MSLDDIREFCKEHLRQHPATKKELAVLIGISLPTFQGFMHGAGVQQKTWKKLEEFVLDQKRNRT